MIGRPVIRVMLVDDHAVVRTGYRRLIEIDADIEVVDEHADADAALAALQAHAQAIDVVVLDLSMPGRSGLDLLRRASLRWPHLRWLVFTMHDSAALVSQALSAGAAGFVTKSSDPDFLVQAVRRVAAGEVVLSPDVAHAPNDPGAQPPHRALSAREFDVFQLLVQGLSIDEIALRVHLSPKTVANHQTLIRSKLGVANGVELLRYAQQHGL